MRIMVKRPGGQWQVQSIRNTLEALQTVVEGWIETVIYPHYIIVCNEEGMICGLKPNCRIQGITYCGTICAVCDDGIEDFTDFPDDLDLELITDTEDFER